MALTHHIIVKIACLRAGKPQSSYALLGDDIVLTDTDVNREYRKLLDVLDMPVSDPKTHIGELYEFAKRWVYKGKEITAFASSGLLETVRNYSLFNNFIETQSHHG